MNEDIKNFQEHNDWESFERIYHHFENTIHKIAHYPLNKDLTKYVYKTTKEEREDLESELKIKLIELTKDYHKDVSKFSYYVNKMLQLHAHNLFLLIKGGIINQKNREIPYIDHEKEEEEEELDELKEKQIKQIFDHLYLLTKKEKKIVELLFMEKMTNKEIQETLKMDKRNLAKYKKQITEKLKDLI